LLLGLLPIAVAFLLAALCVTCRSFLLLLLTFLGRGSSLPFALGLTRLLLAGSFLSAVVPLALGLLAGALLVGVFRTGLRLLLARLWAAALVLAAGWLLFGARRVRLAGFLTGAGGRACFVRALPVTLGLRAGCPLLIRPLSARVALLLVVISLSLIAALGRRFGRRLAITLLFAFLR